MLYICSSVKIICKIMQNNEPLLNHSELLPLHCNQKPLLLFQRTHLFHMMHFQHKLIQRGLARLTMDTEKKLRNQQTSLQSRSVRYQFKAVKTPRAQTCENFCATSLSYISLPSTCVLYKIHGYKDLSVHFCLHREQILDFD